MRGPRCHWPGPARPAAPPAPSGPPAAARCRPAVPTEVAPEGVKRCARSRTEEERCTGLGSAGDGAAGSDGCHADCTPCMQPGRPAMRAAPQPPRSACYPCSACCPHNARRPHACRPQGCCPPGARQLSELLPVHTHTDGSPKWSTAVTMCPHLRGPVGTVRTAFAPSAEH